MLNPAFFKRPVTSNRFDRRLGQLLCLGGAPIVWVVSVMTLQRMSDEPSQLLTGLLAASAVAIAVVILGIVAGPRRAEA
ncbi:MAG TPA: hypothetical protein VLQ45_30175 [Thermoanaerobaculia bacterium]|nr:hypothetical protein [Thermoanaerobaculia bacterium]